MTPSASGYSAACLLGKAGLTPSWKVLFMSLVAWGEAHMKRWNPAFLLVLAWGTLWSLPARATNLDQSQLILVQSTVASVCTSVSTNGYKVSGTLEASIEARVQYLLSKLLPITARAKASISGAKWSGLSQDNAAQAVVANMN